MDIPVVQAGRTVVSSDEILLGAEENSQIQLEATVYSSNSRSFTLETSFELLVRQRSMTYQEILTELGEDFPYAEEEHDNEGEIKK